MEAENRTARVWRRWHDVTALTQMPAGPFQRKSASGAVSGRRQADPLSLSTHDGRPCDIDDTEPVARIAIEDITREDSARACTFGA